MCVCVCVCVCVRVRVRVRVHVRVRVRVCVSEDMLPYCSAHVEWLIMKLCMYAVFMCSLGFHSLRMFPHWEWSEATGYIITITV